MRHSVAHGQYIYVSQCHSSGLPFCAIRLHDLVVLHLPSCIRMWGVGHVQILERPVREDAGTFALAAPPAVGSRSFRCWVRFGWQYWLEPGRSGCAAWSISAHKLRSPRVGSGEAWGFLVGGMCFLVMAAVDYVLSTFYCADVGVEVGFGGFVRGGVCS